MVVDTTYYDILSVQPDATDAELRKAYRKQAIKLHPDKNGDDPSAAEKFQDLGEAYGILLNKETRDLYDRLGKEGMRTQANSTDAAVDVGEFFSMVFGGEGFKDWFGELTMLLDMSKLAKIYEEESEFDDEEVVAATTDQVAVYGENSTQSVTRPEHATHEKKDKQKLSPAQREALLQAREEHKEAQSKQIKVLSEKLLARITAYQKAASDSVALKRHIDSLNKEFDDLKEESFGLKLLQLTAKIYSDQSHATINACKTFGVSKIYSSMKTKGGNVKNGLSMVKSALAVQDTLRTMMVEMDELQEKAEKGEVLTSNEKARQVEIERLITGKILATAWASTKFEVLSTLVKVCDTVLNDKSLPRKERLGRAEALLSISKVMLAVKRSAAEEEDARIFEEMMAEASAKNSKSKKFAYPNNNT